MHDDDHDDHELPETPLAPVLRRPASTEVGIGMDKPIYTISVASEILDTHPRTLMMYESMGLVVPQRTTTNRRRYTPRDIQTLRTIQQLTRIHRVNIAGVRYILALLQLLQQHDIKPPEALGDIDVSHLL